MRRLQTHLSLSKPKGIKSQYPKHIIANIDRGQLYECRICLEAPCKCSGSIEKVHKSCLSKWIQTILSKSNANEQVNSIKCQLCKENINFKTLNKWVIKDKEGIISAINLNQCFFFLLILLLILLILSIIVISIFAIMLKVSFSTKPIQTILIVSVLCCLPLLLFFDIYVIFFQFIIATQRVIYDLISKKMQILENEGNSFQGKITNGQLIISDIT